MSRGRFMKYISMGLSICLVSEVNCLADSFDVHRGWANLIMENSMKYRNNKISFREYGFFPFFQKKSSKSIGKWYFDIIYKNLNSILEQEGKKLRLPSDVVLSFDIDFIDPCTYEEVIEKEENLRGEINSSLESEGLECESGDFDHSMNRVFRSILSSSSSYKLISNRGVFGFDADKKCDFNLNLSFAKFCDLLCYLEKSKIKKDDTFYWNMEKIISDLFIEAFPGKNVNISFGENHRMNLTKVEVGDIIFDGDKKFKYFDVELDDKSHREISLCLGGVWEFFLGFWKNYHKLMGEYKYFYNYLF